jgi:ribosomal protein L40E
MLLAVQKPCLVKMTQNLLGFNQFPHIFMPSLPYIWLGFVRVRVSNDATSSVLIVHTNQANQTQARADMKTSRIICSECEAILSVHAEACHACGYPVVSRGQPALPDENETKVAPLREYKLMQLAGIAMSCAGFAAVLADALVIASVTVTVGVGTYMTGLLGAWWNSAE